jgi:hypothetical protein
LRRGAFSRRDSVGRCSGRLLKEGHRRQSAWRCLRVVGDFRYWLAVKGFGVLDLDELRLSGGASLNRRLALIQIKAPGFFLRMLQPNGHSRKPVKQYAFL